MQRRWTVGMERKQLLTGASGGMFIWLFLSMCGPRINLTISYHADDTRVEQNHSRHTSLLRVVLAEDPCSEAIGTEKSPCRNCGKQRSGPWGLITIIYASRLGELVSRWSGPWRIASLIRSVTSTWLVNIMILYDEAWVVHQARGNMEELCRVK